MEASSGRIISIRGLFPADFSRGLSQEAARAVYCVRATRCRPSLFTLPHVVAPTTMAGHLFPEFSDLPPRPKFHPGLCMHLPAGESVFAVPMTVPGAMELRHDIRRLADHGSIELRAGLWRVDGVESDDSNRPQAVVAMAQG